MEVSSRRRRSPRAQAVVYLVALGVYLCALYLPFLWMPVPAQEWAADAPGVSYWARELFLLAQGIFGSGSPLWRLQNFLLLYACSVCVYFLTSSLLERPQWLASFSAVLFMANPAKGHAIYAQEGVHYWLPTFLALLGLLLYVQWRLKGGGGRWIVGTFLLACALLLLPSQAVLIFPLFLLHLLFGERRHWPQFAASALLLVALCWISAEPASLPHPTTHPMALLLIIYPIGYLPATVQLFDAWPVVEWMAFGVCAGLGWAISRQVKQPALRWGLGSAALMGLFIPAFDLIGLRGAECLLLPMVFVHVALAAVVQAVLRHPKWVKPAVLLTALWCVVYFVLQVRLGLSLWPKA